MAAFQIQVVGALDGATLFVPPTPMPQPVEGGVRKLTAAGAAGLFDIASLIGWQGPALVSCFHVEYSPATLAARCNLVVPGQALTGTQPGARFIADQQRQGAVGILMRPHTLFRNQYLPAGAQLSILTDSVGIAFGGVPVAGPHFVFLDIQPLQQDFETELGEGVASFAQAKQKGESHYCLSFQQVAATATEYIFIADQTLAEPGREFQIDGLVTIGNGAAPAAGESMVIELAVVRPGSSNVLLTQTLDAGTIGGEGILQLALTDQVNNNFGRNERLRVVRTYVAGGGPTPMTNTSVACRMAPIAFSS